MFKMIYIIQRHVVGQNSFERKQSSVMSPTITTTTPQLDLCFRQQYLLTQPGLGDSRRDPGDDVHLTSVENHRLHLSCSIHVYKPPVISPIQIKGQFGACKSYYMKILHSCVVVW